MTGQLLYILAFAVMLIGLWGLLSKRNIIRIIIGFSLLDTGIHMLLLAVGYREGGTAPIVDAQTSAAVVAARGVDPIPSALVLTAIVIGLAVTALMLSYAVRMYERTKSLQIDKNKELKW